jgi:hypothetical protein
MRLLIIGLTACLTLFGQVRSGAGSNRPSAPAPAAAEPLRPDQLCAIHGKVLNAATGEPLNKAALVLQSAEPPRSGGMPNIYTGATGAGGQFRMIDLEPGKYRLSVNRNGYVTMNYGAKSPARPGTTLTLEQGQKMGPLEFRMTPHGVIAGRIVDEDGEPLAHVQVMPMRYRYMQQGRQLVPGGSAQTNDLGEYRIFGLASGKYYVSAAHRGGGMFSEIAADRSGNSGPEEGYVATYYPGTTDPATATPVEVGPGAEVRGVDLTIAKGRTFRIRGRVINNTTAQGMPMVLLEPEVMFFSPRPHNTVARGPNNQFELRGVPAGSYTLAAMINESGRNLAARQKIEVSNQNLENVTLTITAGQELSGEVTVEGSEKPQMTGWRVWLRPAEQGNRFMYGGESGGHIKADGSFTLNNVNPSRLYVNVTGLPDGYFVKSVRSGDQELPDNVVDTTGGAAGALRIIVSGKAGQIDGAVSGAAGATVVLIPEDPKRREQFQNIKMVTTDQHGRFSLKSIEPGDYKLYAWEDVDPGAWMDPDFMKPVVSKGKAVTIREGSRETAQLVLIPPEP